MILKMMILRKVTMLVMVIMLMAVITPMMVISYGDRGDIMLMLRVVMSMLINVMKIMV